MSNITITGLIILGTVFLFVSNRVPVVLVAMSTAMALYATGVLSLNAALSGIGDPAVIFIATLFIVSTGLETSGVTAWAGQVLIAKAGDKSRTRLLVLIAVLVSFLTALISVNGAVAALLPVVIVMAVRLKRAPSQLLMPLVFSAHAGSMLALTGTPVNVLVANASLDAGFGGFGFFEFAIVGLPLLLGTMVIIILFGQLLLPERSGPTIPSDFSKHAQTLVEQYGLRDGLFQLRVRETCPYIGKLPEEVREEDYEGLKLVAIQQGDSRGLLRNSKISEGDFFILRGEAELVAHFAAINHLAFREEENKPNLEQTLFNSDSGLAEVIIPPRSGMIGTQVFQGMVTESGDLIILAIQRQGLDISNQQVVLEAGDTLLLQGTWKALDINLNDPDVLVVNSPELVRRQAVPMGPGAKQMVVILIAMVFLLATGLVPPVVAGLLASGAIVLTGVLNVDQCFKAINWTTVILVGAMMPLSTAMHETGAAEALAVKLVAIVGDAGPYALLAGLFILTAVLGQLISNTATALIVIPIGIATAHSMGVSPQPILMSIAIAAAAAFLTPIATPTNLMVMGPAGYKFGDYWKLGLPLLIWFFIVATFLVPLVWRF